MNQKLIEQPTKPARLYKKALQEGRIVVTGAKYTRNGWTGFRVYEVKGGKLLPIVVSASSYWSEKDGYYRCGAIGTNRVLEVTLSIGYQLGLSFEDMRPQVCSLI